MLLLPRLLSLRPLFLLPLRLPPPAPLLLPPLLQAASAGDLSSPHRGPVSADDLLPVACFVVCNSNMRTPRSTVAYIQVCVQTCCIVVVRMNCLRSRASIQHTLVECC